MNSRTIPLSQPLGPDKRTSLTMRPPKVRDELLAQRQAKEGLDPGDQPTRGESEVCLVALLTNARRTEIEDLDLCDYEKCSEALADFIAGRDAPRTAPTSDD